jgi:6-phospho-3-hexuloisomerase
MRLFHIGLAVAVAGDVTMPPLGPGDLFIAVAGPGELASMLALIKVAKDAGATVLLVTGQPSSSAARLADFSLVIPAQTMADDRAQTKRSTLPMGSAFEGALFLLCEIMVLNIAKRLGVGFDEMRSRHTNIE